MPSHPQHRNPVATEFVLPGRKMNTLAHKRSMISAAAASFSRQWNPRNLEAPWYEVRGMIWSDLVADSSRLAVAPQYRLWYIDPDDSSLRDDNVADEAPFDQGDLTFLSIASDEGEDAAVITDFCITRKHIIHAVATTEFPAMQRRIRYLGIPMLCECKRSGKRCRSRIEGLKRAGKHLLNARKQVENQGRHLFKMYPHQLSIILIAISGFWWTYWIARREVLGDEPEAESEERDDPDDEDYEELADQDGIHRGVPQTDNEDEESDDELLLRPYDDHVNNSQTETAMQPQKPSDGEAIAEQLIAAHLHEVLTLDEKRDGLKLCSGLKNQLPIRFYI